MLLHLEALWLNRVEPHLGEDEKHCFALDSRR